MNCIECPFNGQKRIPGEGRTTIDGKVVSVTEDRQYDVCIVAMAPAEEELRQGRVLVGVSGQILMKHLYQMGIMEYYVCNVLLCRITDDSYVAQAVKCCRDVVEEVKSKGPKLTLALGDLPLRTLAPDLEYTIKECEGRILPSLVGPMLPITHPAYYWRNPEKIFDFTECMRSGIRFLSNKYTQAVEPTYTLVDSTNLSNVLDKLDKYDEVAVDLETTGFFAYGWEPNRILEMGISGDHKHAYIVPAEIIPEFKKILEQKKCRWWNAQFDCAFLKQIGINANAHFDGMLAHYSIDERPYSHGLKRVSQIYLGTDDWEEDLDKWIPKRQKKTVSYEVIPSEVRWEYLSKDVTRTYQLGDVLGDLVNKPVFDKLLMPACRMFIEVENRGMRIDPIKLMDLENIFSNELDKLDEEISGELGYWINANSPTQVSNLVYDKIGIPVDPHFGVSTNKFYLENFRDSHPIIGKVLDYRYLSKAKGGYVEQFARFVDRQFRIHPSIKLFAAVTGRLASEHPAVMNIKSLKDLKRIFLPDIGHILGYFDIKQNEVRWYYVYQRDEHLGEILGRKPTPENPRANDPHYEVSKVAYGEERADTMRMAAKAGVFGRMYKRGRKDMERQFGSGVIDAVMETIDGLFPDIDKYYSSIMQKVRSQGYLESYFGRRRRFSLITPDNKHEVERQAVNFPIQSAGSDLMLLNMLHIFENRNKWDVWPFWPVHDSITMDIPDVSMIPTIKKELEEYSLELVDGIIPFIWEPDWGLNWAMDKE